jgi:hypothetical protein
LVPAPRRAHLHLLVTDGGFRPDGTFVRPPRHDVATLTEAVRRTVFRMFVKRELIDGDTAQSMLAWPHAGFHVHDGVRAAADDMAFTVDPEPETLREARRRWAELLRRLFEVDPLACPRCGTTMRIVAFLTDPTTIDRILEHLRRSAPTRTAQAVDVAGTHRFRLKPPPHPRAVVAEGIAGVRGDLNLRSDTRRAPISRASTSRRHLARHSPDRWTRSRHRDILGRE